MDKKETAEDNRDKQIEHLLALVLANNLKIFNLQKRLNNLEYELYEERIMDEY